MELSSIITASYWSVFSRFFAKVPFSPYPRAAAGRHHADLFAVFEKTVNRFCLFARKLGHSFCGATRGSRESERYSLLFKIVNDSVESGGFTGAGSARKNHYFVAETVFYGVFLIFRKSNSESIFRILNIFAEISRVFVFEF